MIYQTDEQRARACARSHDDKELIPAMRSAKKCYWIYLAVGDTVNAEFSRMLYWFLRDEIAKRWK